jgi:hypothetical protein
MNQPLSAHSKELFFFFGFSGICIAIAKAGGLVPVVVSVVEFVSSCISQCLKSAS